MDRNEESVKENHIERTRNRRESGQAIVEYVLLISIVLGAILFFVRKMTDLMDTTAASNGGQIEAQLRTGHAGPKLWKK